MSLNETVIGIVIGGFLTYFFGIRLFFKKRLYEIEIERATLKLSNSELKERILKLDEKISDCNKRTENQQKIIADHQAKITEYESKDRILAKYPMDKRTGLRAAVGGEVLCLKCAHNKPPNEQIMEEEKYGWRCRLCGDFQRNDRPLPRPNKPRGIA